MLRISSASPLFWSCRTPRYMPILSVAVRPTTLPSPTSSRESAQAIVLEPEPSRLIGRFWLALHLLLLAAAAASALPWLGKAAAALLLAAHAARGRPVGYIGTIVCRPDGRFDLPEQQRAGLALARGSRFTRRWARLVLEDAAGVCDVLLLHDQLDDSRWRLLLSHVGAAR